MLERLFVENYKEVNNNYSDIKDFRNNYDFEMLISKAKFRLQSFLGCEMLDSSAKLKPVYFLFLNADAQDRDEAIVVDLNFFYRMDEDARVNLIAHEFFHAYRRHFENHDFNYANDINFALDMIANEGIADQIDIASFPAPASFPSPFLSDAIHRVGTDRESESLIEIIK